AVLVLNQHYFRERPIAELNLANLFYAPTDSSFPANPAAIAFAVAMSIWLGNRRASALLFFLAALWSFTRVYNGLFYPSDIAAGALDGVAMSCIVALAFRAIEPLPTWVLRGARLLHLA
ncbi:MAG: phosphatase PAP2 family protein, partial [Chloroflexota bacterium]